MKYDSVLVENYNLFHGKSRFYLNGLYIFHFGQTIHLAEVKNEFVHNDQLLPSKESMQRRAHFISSLILKIKKIF